MAVPTNVSAASPSFIYLEPPLPNEYVPFAYLWVRGLGGLLVLSPSCRLKAPKGVFESGARLESKRLAGSRGFQLGVPRETPTPVRRLHNRAGGGPFHRKPITNRPTLLVVEPLKPWEEPVLIERLVLLHPLSMTVALICANAFSGLLQAVQKHSSHLAHLMCLEWKLATGVGTFKGQIGGKLYMRLRLVCTKGLSPHSSPPLVGPEPWGQCSPQLMCGLTSGRELQSSP